MSETQEFLDTPTAVHLTRLQGDLKVLGASQAHAGTLLESLSSDVRTLTERSARAVDNGDSIRRIWERMEKQEGNMHSLDRRQNGMRNLAVGAFAMSGLLVGVIGWIGNEQIAAIKETARELRSEARRADERMDRVEVYLAGSKAEEFKR